MKYLGGLDLLQEVRYVYLSVAVELLEYRGKAPKQLSSKPANYMKLLMFGSSIILPITSLFTAFVYGATVTVALLLIGLRRAVLHILASVSILYFALFTSSIIFHGSVEGVLRFTAFAASTLPTLIFIFATTKPSTLKSIPQLYLTLVVFSSTIREVVDVATSYKAKGSTGLGYWIRVVVASVALTLGRAQVLADSLRMRGFEVVE
jgi:hypothetical protein